MPDLLSHLTTHRENYDLFIFFTYLYFPTAFGLRPVADKAILVPTANPASHLWTFNAFMTCFLCPK